MKARLLILLSGLAFGTAQAAIDPAETCEDKPLGAACWLQLANKPNCYIWNSSLQDDETANWTGRCRRQLANGPGQVTWFSSEWEGASRWDADTSGRLKAGKAEGTIITRNPNGDVAEMPYVEGEIHGTVNWKLANGDVQKIPYVNGKIHGTAFLRNANGVVRIIPHVEGERHGTEIEHKGDGPPLGYEIKTPYVDGKRHGTQIWREANGDVIETPYVEGEIHGIKVTREADGDVIEDPYVHGINHGTEIRRKGNGDVIETPYVEGERHGIQIERDADGDVIETPYVEGEIHGTRIQRLADGDVTETPYVEGKIHGTVIHTFASGDVIEAPYVEGERGETSTLRRANGQASQGPYWFPIDGRPDCYATAQPQVFNTTPATWTGACKAGFATGSGLLTWRSVCCDQTWETTIADGYPQGPVVIHRVNRVNNIIGGESATIESTAIAGRLTGQTKISKPNSTEQGRMVNGQRSGKWTSRGTDSDGEEWTEESFYAGGKRQGSSTKRMNDGTTIRTPYRNGKPHGKIVGHFPETDTRAEGTHEDPYVDGVNHGTEIWQFSNGYFHRIPWVNGERHGTEVERSRDGNVTEIDWENGQFIACRSTNGGTEEINGIWEERECRKIGANSWPNLGLVVEDVPEGARVIRSTGPAADSGIRTGDIITRIHLQTVEGARSISEIDKTLPKGQLVSVAIVRGGATTFVAMKVPD